MRPIDFTGERIGMLTVLRLVSVNPHVWLVRCECGVEKNLKSCYLVSRVQSCGCLLRVKGRFTPEQLKARGEKVSKSKTVHGESDPPSPEFRAWSGMKTRCLNRKNKRYPEWGGRGVTICEKWLNSYQAFLEDVGRKPSPRHSLDRYPDNNGNYEPGNVRWATPEQQSNNRRKRRWHKKPTGVCA